MDAEEYSNLSIEGRIALEQRRLDQHIQANAVRFLLEGGETEVALALLSCSLTSTYRMPDNWNSDYSPSLDDIAKMQLRTQTRETYNMITDYRSSFTESIDNAIRSIAPGDYHINTGYELRPVTENWKAELTELIQGKTITNQGITATLNNSGTIWEGLRFGSESERRIAAALDLEGVLYFPNCMGRLGPPDNRKKLEPDFLVCYEGKWGILEVDGDRFHPATRTVHDHERDRRFIQQGIRVIQHYDAPKCYQTPQRVVREFLEILKKS